MTNGCDYLIRELDVKDDDGNVISARTGLHICEVIHGECQFRTVDWTNHARCPIGGVYLHDLPGNFSEKYLVNDETPPDEILLETNLHIHEE